MKVKELIEELQKLDQEMEIYSISGDEILGDYRFVNVYISETMAYKDKDGTLTPEYSNYCHIESSKIKVYEIK